MHNFPIAATGAVGYADPIILSPGVSMEIRGKVAVVTGAGSGIGQAAALDLAGREVAALALVDRSDAVQQVAAGINDRAKKTLAHAFVGDATQPEFRRRVFDEIQQKTDGLVARICIPAAGITRDTLSVRLDKTTGAASIYPEELFRLVTEVNLIAPTYWALEMIA